MQFTTNKKALRDAVARVNAIVPSMPRSTAFSGILIEAVQTSSGDHVSVTADDLSVSYIVRIAAGVSGAGSFTVDAAKFKKALAGGKRMDAIAVSSERDLADDETGFLKVEANGVVLTVPSTPARPMGIELAEDGGEVLWPSGTLAESLRRVSFAMSNEGTRYYLNGLFIRTHGELTVSFIATDGDRLARDGTPLSAGHRDVFEWPENDNKRGLIVPALAIHALERACKIEKEAEYPVTVQVASNGIAFHGRDYDLVTKAIDGTFPDYERVFPNLDAKGRKETRFDLGAFGEALKASGMAMGRTVKINGDARIVDPDGSEAIIPHAPDLGDNVLGFNSAYLVDLGKVFGGEVSMHYGTGKEAWSPVLFRSESMPEFVAIQMPMRV